MASTDDFYSFMSGNVAPEQPDSDVAAIENNPGVAAQYAAIDRLQHAKDVTKRYIDQMGQTSSETPGGIFGRLWPYGGKVYTDQQLADAKSAVDRAQNDDEVYQAIRNLANANDQSEVGTGVGGMLARGMNNTPIASIGNNSLLGNNRTKYEYPEDDSSWAYAIGKYGGGLVELASDLAGAADTLKMAKAARFNPFNFAGRLYSDAKQTGKDIVNLPGNIVNGIRNAGSKTSDFVKDSIKAGTEGKSLKAYRTPESAGETAQTGGRAAETAETAAPTAERTAASAPERTAPAEGTAAPAPRQEPAPAPRQEPAPAPRQEPAPAPRQEPAPAPRQEPAPAPRQEPAPAEGSTELRSNENGTPDLASAINGEGAGATGGAPKTGAGEAAGSAPKTGAGEAAGSAPATGNVPKRGEAFDDVSWSNDIAARDQAADFATSGKYGVKQAADWYRGQLISNANLGNAAIDREIARFIQQFTGGAK